MSSKKGNHIEIFARVRPTKRPAGLLEIDYADHAVAVHQPRDQTMGLVNNSREHYNFAFSRVLDASTDQDTVFEAVAQPVVDSTLEGFNGTIFAYGQTGSGKTHSIMGYGEDPGVVPRCCEELTKMLAELDPAKGTFTLKASYLQIYREVLHDL